MKPKNDLSKEEKFRPLTSFLRELKDKASSPISEEGLAGMGFGELRDALLAHNPLDGSHVKKVNAAEAEYWRRSEGLQVKPSDELLQFDCGGQVSPSIKKVVFSLLRSCSNSLLTVFNSNGF